MSTKVKVKTDNTELFERAPVPKAVIALVVPTIISQIITVIYNMADTYFIGQMNNPAQVAAATLSMPIFMMLTGFANLFGIGGASFISRCLGIGDKNKAKKCASFSIWGSIIVALVYGLSLYMVRPVMLPALGADTSTYKYCSDYILWTITIGGIPTVLSACLSHLVRAEGYSKEASIGIALGGVMNIALDPVFIFFFNFGVAGAAMATMLSNLISTIYFVRLILKNKEHTVIKFAPKYFTVQYGIPKEVLLVGFPSFIMMFMGTVSNLCLNKVVVSYSNESIAGMGIAKKIDLLAFAVATGMTQGILPLVAYNYGSKNYTRMKAAIKTAFIYGFVLSVVSTVFLFVCAVPVVRVFINNADTVSYGQYFLKAICITTPAVVVAMMIITIFQATGKKTRPLILSLLRKGVLDIPFMYLMNGLAGANGVPWATPIADMLTMFISVGLFVPYWKHIGRLTDQYKAEDTISTEKTPVELTNALTNKIITIGRSYGSGGRTVGKMVAEKLGISYYDSELLEQAAMKSGLSKQFFESRDEKISGANMLYGYAGFVSDQYSRIEKMANKAQREIIEEVASKGACVIVGRRADQILKGNDQLLRVFITAPMESRVERVMERENMSAQESQEKIRKVDKERSEYYNVFSESHWGDANNYDLCLDTSKIGIEKTVDLIVQLVKN